MVGKGIRDSQARNLMVLCRKQVQIQRRLERIGDTLLVIQT